MDNFNLTDPLMDKQKMWKW